MPIAGYVFAIRSERLICREVQVNLAHRWFRKLGIEDSIPDHSPFSRAHNERFREREVLRPFCATIDACTAALPPFGDRPQEMFDRGLQVADDEF
jgi:hypothetical protein